MNEERNKISVFLVDDHPIVREGVRSYLTSCGVVVMGEASDAPEALRKLRKLTPDVIVLDVNLPSMDGWELASRLCRLVPKARILAFSIHSSEEYMVRMARCGARGYVTKDQPTDKLFDAIKHVAKGGRYFPASMPDALLTSAPEFFPNKSDSVALTGRELKVLSLLAKGFSCKNIAAKLSISFRMVETHRERLSHKLNIMTIAGLAKYAVQHELA